VAIVLSPIEARVLGSLVEKSLTTPDLYPLSLNSLLNACNQKSSRDPVMTLDETAVARALASLREKSLAYPRSEAGNRTPKFGHHIENLLKGGSAKEVGAMCVLLLRGPQTPGEIKTRTDRMCEFESVAEVVTVLDELGQRPDGPLVVRLPRQSGQKEARYRHTFFDEAAVTVPQAGAGEPRPKGRAAVPSAPPAAKPPDRLARLEERIKLLEERLRVLESRSQASVTDEPPVKP
jgi:uncharacterized protein